MAPGWGIGNRSLTWNQSESKLIDPEIEGMAQKFVQWNPVATGNYGPCWAELIGEGGKAVRALSGTRSNNNHSHHLRPTLQHEVNLRIA